MGVHKLYRSVALTDVIDLDNQLAGKAATGHTHAASLVPFAPQTFTDGATITINANLGTFFRGTLGGNRTLAMSNGTDGQRVLVEANPGASARTLTLSGITPIVGATSPISIPANKRWFGGLLLSSSVWYLIASAVLA